MLALSSAFSFCRNHSPFAGRILSFLTGMIACCALLLTAMSSSWALEPQQEQKRMSKKDVEDAIVSWKGERVRLLGNEPYFTHLKYIGGDGSCIHRAAGDKGSLPAEQYAGLEGTIVEVKPEGHSRLPGLIVEMDGTKEQISAVCSYGSLGFLSEFDRARQLIGRTVWTKGELELTPPEEYSKDLGRQARIKTHNIEPLTITRVDWGYSGRPVLLCMTNAAGQAGCMLNNSDGGRPYNFGPQFVAGYVSVSYTELLHMQDPRKTFPTWGSATWGLIAEGTVAIGMTEDMAKMACGKPMIAMGAELDMSGNEVATMYHCYGHGRYFFIRNGKVIKYGDR
jgi:hypothetical protein